MKNTHIDKYTMKRFYVFLVALWVASFAMAQSDVSGQVIDEQGEALIVYVLAAASPTHSIDRDVYTEGWARNRLATA